MNLSVLRSFCICSNKELKKSMLLEIFTAEKLEILVIKAGQELLTQAEQIQLIML